MVPDNILAVIVAALLPMIVGSLWYGPIFGKRWMELMELTEEEIKANFNPAKSYGGSLVMALVTSYILAILMQGMGLEGLMGGLHIALLCWLGFVVTHGFQSVAFENKKPAVYVMGMGYNLVTLALMGALLGIWT